MKINIKKTLAVTALALGGSLFAASSHAVAINATMSVTGLGTSTYVGSDLNSATSFNFGNAGGFEFMVTSVPALAFGNPNDFASGGSAVPVLSFGDSATSVSISSFVAITNFWVWSTGTTTPNRYTFDLLTLTRNATSIGAMDLYGTGTFIDGDGVFENTAASVRLTAQEAAGSVSWSASWASPPFSNQVPEPVSLGLLGIGLMGLAASRRKAA